MKCGIYKITNIINLKFYIGSSINIEKRIRRHFSYLKRSAHTNPLLQNCYNKYGLAAFKHEIIELVDDQNKLIEREQYYIDILSPTYNVLKIASSHLGAKRSEESCKRISDAQKKYFSIYGSHNKGIPKSAEVIRKIVIANTGQKRSEDAKKKMSEAQKKFISIHGAPRLGDKHTDSAKLKMSKAKLGRKLLPESIEKREATKKKNGTHLRTEETRKKISAARRAGILKRKLQPVSK